MGRHVPKITCFFARKGPFARVYGHPCGHLWWPKVAISGMSTFMKVDIWSGHLGCVKVDISQAKNLDICATTPRDVPSCHCGGLRFAVSGCAEYGRTPECPSSSPFTPFRAGTRRFARRMRRCPASAPEMRASCAGGTPTRSHMRVVREPFEGAACSPARVCYASHELRRV